MSTDLIKKIRGGEVQGLLVWKLDRLARNMVDGGELIYELSEGRLKEIITPEATYMSVSADSADVRGVLFDGIGASIGAAQVPPMRVPVSRSHHG